MIMKMYALKDRLNDYSYPIPFVNDNMAKRYWEDTCRQNESIQNNPGDFTFDEIGEWNSELGIVVSKPTKDRNILKVIVKGEK